MFTLFHKENNRYEVPILSSEFLYYQLFPEKKDPDYETDSVIFEDHKGEKHVITSWKTAIIDLDRTEVLLNTKRLNNQEREKKNNEITELAKSVLNEIGKINEEIISLENKCDKNKQERKDLRKEIKKLKAAKKKLKDKEESEFFLVITNSTLQILKKKKCELKEKAIKAEKKKKSLTEKIKEITKKHSLDLIQQNAKGYAIKSLMIKDIKEYLPDNEEGMKQLESILKLFSQSLRLSVIQAIALHKKHLVEEVLQASGTYQKILSHHHECKKHVTQLKINKKRNLFSFVQEILIEQKELERGTTDFKVDEKTQKELPAEYYKTKILLQGCLSDLGNRKIEKLRLFTFLTKSHQNMQKILKMDYRHISKLKKSDKKTKLLNLKKT